MSLGEVETEWSIDDVWDAHTLLDIYERMEEKSSKDFEAQARRKG